MMEDHDELPTSEQSPLLGRIDRPAGQSHPIAILLPVHSPRFVIVVILCALFVIMFGDFLTTAPLLRVFEDIICRHYYNDVKGQGRVALTEDIDERLCKIDEIQEELALIVGGLTAVNSIPGLLFALPYGVLADRIGRKPVFALAYTGIILSLLWNLAVCWFWKTLPLRLVWINPLFQIIGGGNAISQSTFYAIVSDISMEANRANHFFLVGFSIMAAEFIAPSVASSLMLRSPWIPLVAGVIVMIIGGLFMLFVPETLHRKPINGSMEHVEELSDSSSGSSLISAPPMKHSLIHKFKRNFINTFNTLRVYASPTFFALIAAFLLQLFGRQIIDLIMRYISKRFNWTLAQAGFLLSLRALINIFLFLTILPGISHILTSSASTAYSIPGLRFNLSTGSKDLVLARISLIIQISGAFLLALSAFSFPVEHSDQENLLPLMLAILGIIVYTLGMGFNAFCRSLISSLVAREHIARLYAILSIFDIVGASITGPILAWLYSWGLKLSRQGARNEYLGMPFWGAMVLTALAGGGIMWVKAPERNNDTVEEENIRVAESDLQTELLL